MAVQGSLKPEVAGSSPAGGTLSVNLLLLFTDLLFTPVA